MRMLAPYVAALAILQLAACDSPQPAQSKADTQAPAETAVAGPERVVVAFGDSLYAGYGLNRGEGLADELQSQLRAGGINARVVKAGVSGDTSAAGRQRLAFTLDSLEAKPDLVLLGLGGNDMLRQLPPAETRANMTAMLDELKRRGIPVILTGMVAAPNLGPDYARDFNAIYPELAAEYGATLDPFILDGVIGVDGMMLPDGLHPSAEGVDAIANRLAPLVAEKLSDN
nr:arylesterase [Sphingomonas gilva]